jgi:hypothetical protein
MTTITTTFTALRKAEACTEGYRKLAKHLGGITKYGKIPPFRSVSFSTATGWTMRSGCCVR